MNNRYEVAIRMVGPGDRPGIFTGEKPFLTRYQAKKQAARFVRRGLVAFARRVA